MTNHVANRNYSSPNGPQYDIDATFIEPHLILRTYSVRRLTLSPRFLLLKYDINTKLVFKQISVIIF